MFQGQRGWFCRSVSQDLRQFWVDQGGELSDAQAADFLFSCDAAHPDTLRIYQSLQYIEDNATVFHASYLSAVANTEVENAVSIGFLFFLLHVCKKHARVTSREKESTGRTTEHKEELSRRKSFTKDSDVEKQVYLPLQNYPVNNMVTGYISIDALEKFLGELHDFIPGSSGYLAYHVQNEINMSAIKKQIKKESKLNCT